MYEGKALDDQVPECAECHQPMEPDAIGRVCIDCARQDDADGYEERDDE